MKTKTVLRWFWAWQDEEEERWLEEMARQGWHLLRGGLVFRFERGEPREMRYRLDYRQGTGKSLREYFALLRDAGWEYVDSFAGWRYFRSPAAAEAPEIYTDAASRAAKYRRLAALLVFLLVLQAVNLNHMLNSRRLTALWGAAAVLVAAVAVLLIYALFRLKRRIAREASGLT